MDSLDIKAEQAAYWRFVRQMPVVAVEALDEDVLVVSQSRKLFVVEIKVSLQDLRQDRFKSKHADIRNVLGLPLLEKQVSYHSDPLVYGQVPNYFYFAVPAELRDKAFKILIEFYPYAGLILISEDKSGTRLLGRYSEVVNQAGRIHGNKLSLHKISHLVKAQSASLANAYGHLVRMRRSTDGVSLH